MVRKAESFAPAASTSSDSIGSFFKDAIASGKTVHVGAVADGFTIKDGRKVGVTLRLFTEDGNVLTGTYASARLASQFDETDPAMVGAVTKYGRGAVLAPPTDDKVYAAIVKAMKAAGID